MSFGTIPRRPVVSSFTAFRDGGRGSNAGGLAIPWIPDVLTQEQWFAQRGRASQPEHRLLLAVLEEAWANLRLEGFLRRDARAWFQADDPEWPFSFVTICEALNLPTAKVRAAALAKPAELQRVRVRATHRDISPLALRCRRLLMMNPRTIGQLRQVIHRNSETLLVALRELQSIGEAEVTDGVWRAVG